MRTENEIVNVCNRLHSQAQASYAMHYTTTAVELERVIDILRWVIGAASPFNRFVESLNPRSSEEEIEQ